MPATPSQRHARRPEVRSRFIVAAVVAALVAAFAVTAPASALPSCRIGDTLTKHRKYPDWHRSLLDTYYKLPSTYAPSGRTNTSAAGLTSGYYVRTIMISDLKAMASAARAAGARLAVQSAYRSYSNQKATFDYWVRVDGYDQGERPRRPQRAPARDDARFPQLQRRRPLGPQRLGDDQGGRVAEGERLEVRVHHELPEGQVVGHLLRL